MSLVALGTGCGGASETPLGKAILMRSEVSPAGLQAFFSLRAGLSPFIMR